jgi:hypothetical protein
MDARFRHIAALAAGQHSAVSSRQLRAAGISSSLCSQWVRAGLLERLGPKSFSVAGSSPTWMCALTAAWFDLDGVGWVAGRSAARMQGLDGFGGDHLELLVPREFRSRRSSGRVRSAAETPTRADVVRIEGLMVVRAERLILDAPLFRFSRREIENAIDSALRLRLVGEQRLRTKVVQQHSRGINGGRLLLDALVDTGGESRLERWFLRLVREAGIERPMLQKVFRADGRTIARVDAFFPGGLVVEVAGHGTHATRRQLQSDAQRQTELTLRGCRVLTFTYTDVRDRPDWVVARLFDALRLVA